MDNPMETVQNRPVSIIISGASRAFLHNNQQVQSATGTSIFFDCCDAHSTSEMGHKRTLRDVLARSGKAPKADLSLARDFRVPVLLAAITGLPAD